MMMKHFIKGFSTAEIAITLAISGLVLALAVPSFVGSINRNTSDSATQKLFHSLHFAKVEAIKRNQLVGVCGSTDLTTCSSNWSTAYIIYVDTNRNGTRDNDETIIRVEQNKGPVTINSGAVTSVRFAPTGRSLARTTFDIASNAKAPHSIVVFDSGRVRVQ